MKPGEASQTAVLVCMGRAAAHGVTLPERFSDPTALPLLPDEARAKVERYRAGAPAASLRERVSRRLLSRHSQSMAARTVAIDDAVSEAAVSQLVILGAGLDGRAWRMPGSRVVVVYHSAAFILRVVNLFVRRVGEPYRSVLRALLARHGFDVTEDRNLPEIAAALSPELLRAVLVMKHLRIATAERRES